MKESENSSLNELSTPYRARSAESDGLALPDWSGQVAHVSRVPRAQWLAYCQANLPRLRRQPGFAARRRENGIRAEFQL
jgi:hypothetical protein